MKILCSICRANPTEIPDDVQLGPDFRFACSACLPKGDATKPTKLKAHARRKRRDADHEHDYGSASISVEEFLDECLPKITKIARRFAREYELPIQDCFSEAKVALYEAKLQFERTGNPLTFKIVCAIASRALSRFAERELAECGRVREVNPETGQKTWKNLVKKVVSFDKGWKPDRRAAGRWSRVEEGNQNEDKKPIPLYETIKAIVDSPEEEAIARERERQVKEARQELPSLQQKVLRLLFDEGLTVEQAASILGLSKSKVWRISTEAKAAIARKLKNLGMKIQERPTLVSRGLLRPEKMAA